MAMSVPRFRGVRYINVGPARAADLCGSNGNFFLGGAACGLLRMWRIRRGRLAELKIKIRPVNGGADVVNAVDDAGQRLVQAGADKVIDVDELQPAGEAQ